MESRKLQTGHRPELLASDAWVAATATVIGEVAAGAGSSVWYGAVIRGDTARIQIGQRTNIQDLACLHADPGFPCTLGDDVTVGHGAIVHGAQVADRVLIGIRATVLNGAKIGEDSIVAAGAVVLEGQQIPPRSLVVGIPAKVVRSINDEDVARIMHAANHYVTAAQQYRNAGDKSTFAR